MKHTTAARLVRRLTLTLAIPLLALSLVFTGPFTPSAQALASCPPMSSLCSPAGLAVLGSATMAEGAVATTATALTGTAAASAALGSVSFSGGTWVAAGGSLFGGAVLTVAGMEAVDMITGDKTDAWLGSTDAIDTGGWNTNTLRTDWPDVYRIMTVTGVVSPGFAPAPDGSVKINVMYSVSPRADGSTATVPVSLERRCTNAAGSSNQYTSLTLLHARPGSAGQGVLVTGCGGSFPYFAGIRMATSVYVAPGFPGTNRPLPSGGTKPGTVTRTVSCTGGGTPDVDVSGKSEIGIKAASVFRLPAVYCPPGKVAKKAKVDWTPANVPDAPKQEIVPEFIADPWALTLPTEYPQCMNTTCLLELFEVIPSGSPQYCGAYAVACPEWYTNPQKTSKFECHYGPYVVDLAKCDVYRAPGQLVPNTELDPDKGTMRPVAPGPDGGLPVPTPSPTAPPTQQTGDGCFPKGWGAFNPVEWVMKPVGCALQKAFVPSTATQTKISNLQTTATQVTPMPQLQSLFAWLKPPSAAPTCGSFGIPIWFIDKTLTAVDTCNPNDPIMKGLRPLRPVLELAVWVGMFAPLAWWAWREYAPGSKGVA